MKRIMPFIVAGALLLAACGQPAPTVEPFATVPPAPTAAPAPTATSLPQGVTLTYGQNAQVELVTPTGRHIYVDVVYPSLLLRKPEAEDVLLITHLHDDHYQKKFVDAFPGKQLFVCTGKIELPDVTITGIAAGHNAGDPLLEKDGTDYIYLIETGGLRIAHFGDIGQEALTAEQLTALGTVDVAVMQFDNSFSDMNAANQKGFHLMDQVKPRLIIPTHDSLSTLEIAFKQWKGYSSESRTVTITRSSLPEETGILVVADKAATYGKRYPLQGWK